MKSLSQNNLDFIQTPYEFFQRCEITCTPQIPQIPRVAMGPNGTIRSHREVNGIFLQDLSSSPLPAQGF